MNPRGFGWICFFFLENCGLVWGAGWEMRALNVLMDNWLDLGNIYLEKRFGFGFGFPVIGRVGFGPEILPREGLYNSVPSVMIRQKWRP